jgi:hypothetical protein
MQWRSVLPRSYWPAERQHDVDALDEAIELLTLIRDHFRFPIGTMTTLEVYVKGRPVDAEVSDELADLLEMARELIEEVEG